MENPNTDSEDPKNNPSTPARESPRNPDLIPQVPPPVEKKSETTYCKPDQAPLWKIVLEVFAVIVGIIVAWIYYGQLSVMRGQLGEIIKQYPEIKKTADAANATLVEGRATSTEQLRKLGEYVTEAEKSNAIAIAANRPWVAHVPINASDPHNVRFFEPMKDPEGKPFINARYIWAFKNAGKRPAKVERIRDTGNWYKSCTETPDYDFIPPGTIRDPRTPHKSRALILPDATILSLFQTQVPVEKWQLIQQNELRFCIYSLVEYRDVDYPSVLHHTTTCSVMVVLDENKLSYAACDNNYAQAD
jgi:hypothetical protein